MCRIAGADCPCPTARLVGHAGGGRQTPGHHMRRARGNLREEKGLWRGRVGRSGKAWWGHPRKPFSAPESHREGHQGISYAGLHPTMGGSQPSIFQPVPPSWLPGEARLDREKTRPKMAKMDIFLPFIWAFTSKIGLKKSPPAGFGLFACFLCQPGPAGKPVRPTPLDPSQLFSNQHHFQLASWTAPGVLKVLLSFCAMDQISALPKALKRLNVSCRFGWVLAGWLGGCLPRGGGGCQRMGLGVQK